MHKIILITISTLLSLTLAGCANQTDTNSSKDGAQEAAVYQKITAEEAKQIIDGQTGSLILDVRTDEEFASGHIENAILLPDYEIEENAQSLLPDKDAQILVYCRSGRRSAAAAKALLALGYTDVLDFGGINDWPYETVQ